VTIGKESVEDGSREVTRVALLGPDGPSATGFWEVAQPRPDCRLLGNYPQSPVNHH
jgi:hypothetical protein